METPTIAEQQSEEARRAQFGRVMNDVAERAWADHAEEAVMAALFDVLMARRRRWRLPRWLIRWWPGWLSR
jgi:hypothetical protein